MYDVIDAQARGMSKMAHELVLMRVELKDLRTANEVLSKRRRAKKVRLRAGGSLSMQEAENLITKKDVDEQLKEETSYSDRRLEGSQVRTSYPGPGPGPVPAPAPGSRPVPAPAPGLRAGAPDKVTPAPVPGAGAALPVLQSRFPRSAIAISPIPITISYKRDHATRYKRLRNTKHLITFIPLKI
ncbi:hypothetical protein V493_00911 [Pseudogymnoascus sp. VKM F-4281 (FW-2241)]|nr:hypothetical protein V493_00911 [Pseudogymnoascus sp. VKM F-4281 (FW-2241)]